MLNYLSIIRGAVQYKEDGINKKVKIDVGNEFSPHEMDLEEMIKYIVRAGYEVRKGSAGGG